MRSLPWVQLRSMHRRHPGLPSLPAVVDASSSKKAFDVQIPSDFPSTPERRSEFHGMQSQVSPHCHQFMG